MALRMQLSMVTWIFGSALAENLTCCPQAGAAAADGPNPWIAALPSMVAQYADDPPSRADEFWPWRFPAFPGWSSSPP